MNNQEKLDVKKLIDDINQFNSKKQTNVSKGKLYLIRFVDCHSDYFLFPSHLDERNLNQESAKFWIKLFNSYFLIECNSYNDDILFFVRNRSKRNKFSSKHQVIIMNYT
jgi:hypothetical protein